MKKKFVWLIVSCLMVLALVLASCGPAVTEEEEDIVTEEEEEEEGVVEEEEEEEVEMVKLTLEKADGTIVEKLVEKPKYGGEYTFVRSTTILYFDDVKQYTHSAQTMNLTHEELMQGDWSKGPAGTGEATWLYNIFPSPSVQAGILATHWEMPDADTQIFHIRRGIRWHDKPPTNGRELTADDIVFSLMRLWTTPTQFRYGAYPFERDLVSITATDKWTVVIEYQPGRAGPVYEIVADHSKIVPRDAIEMYGDMTDWRNAIGTGPFVLVDYVDASSVTFERNANYWGTDPLHPDNQLPYLDGVKWLVIPDASTRLAAMRTGKIDQLGLGWEDAGELIPTNPELQYITYYTGTAATLHYRLDKPDLPFYDVMVRRALNMAVNNQEIIDTIFGGQAELLTWPLGPITELLDMYTPLEEMPESVREQFEYHPDKARQMIADAGYPDGFKTEVVTTSGGVDMLAVVQSYWAEIGVELEILVKDYAVYSSMLFNKSYGAMFMASMSDTLPHKFVYTKPGSVNNYSMVDDPVIWEAYEKVSAAYFDWDERARLMKEIAPYMLDLAPALQFPGGYAYVFWQPWVKGYHGENSVGYMSHYNYPKYIWIDQDLKEELTGKR